MKKLFTLFNNYYHSSDNYFTKSDPSASGDWWKGL